MLVEPSGRVRLHTCCTCSSNLVISVLETTTTTTLVQAEEQHGEIMVELNEVQGPLRFFVTQGMG